MSQKTQDTELLGTDRSYRVIASEYSPYDRVGEKEDSLR
jgi:hypothetical protein